MQQDNNRFSLIDLLANSIRPQIVLAEETVLPPNCIYSVFVKIDGTHAKNNSFSFDYERATIGTIIYY